MGRVAARERGGGSDRQVRGTALGGMARGGVESGRARGGDGMRSRMRKKQADPEPAKRARPREAARGRRGALRTRFASVEAAVADIAAGRMVIVVDDEDRENEGDLTIAAEKVTPEAINFMAGFGRGLICLPMTSQRLAELELPLMVEENTSTYQTAFCVSIEAKKRVSTGISAADRPVTGNSDSSPTRATSNPRTISP